MWDEDDPYVPGRVFVCTDCNEVFEDRIELEEHKNKCSTKREGGSPKLIYGNTELLLPKIKLHRIEFNETSMQEFDIAVSNSKPPLLAKFGNGSSLQCTICGRSYNRINDLRHHVKYIHENPNSFKCWICEKTVNVSKELDYHILLHHTNIRPYTCRCGSGYIKPSFLKNHMKKCKNKSISIDQEYSNNSKQEYKCPICSLVFTNVKVLVKHIRRHVKPSDPIENVKEIENLQKESSPSEHNVNTLAAIAYATGRRKFQCKICGKKFTRPDHVRRHIKCVHGKSNSFTCWICGETYNQSHQLNNHILQHHTDIIRPFQCLRCGKGFHRKYRLNEHMCQADYNNSKQVTGNVDQQDLPISCSNNKTQEFKCPVCNAIFINVGIFIRHIRCHGNPVPPAAVFSKNEGERVPVENVPVANMTTVADDNDSMDQNTLQCKICSKNFSHIKHLRRHVKYIHKNPNSFKCCICGKTCNLANILDAHILRHHTNIRPFQCAKCGKGFINKSSLNEHNTRKSSCKLKKNKNRISCSSIGQEKSSITLKSSENRKCPICCATFVNRKVLLKHIRRHGNQVSPSEDTNGISNSNPLEKSNSTGTNESFVTSDIVQASSVESKIFSKNFYLSRLLLDRSKHTLETKCQLCSKNFSRHDNLNDHIQQIHTNIRNFQCNKCSRGFIRKSKFIDHMKLISCTPKYIKNPISGTLEQENVVLYLDDKKQQLQCPFCTSKFLILSVLIKHVQNHGNQSAVSPETSKSHGDNIPATTSANTIATILPQYSPPCTMRANRLTNLKTQVTEFKCRFCNFTTSHIRSCQRHEDNHFHSNEIFRVSSYSRSTSTERGAMSKIVSSSTPMVYRCKLCEQGTASLRNLKRHVKRKHPDCIEDPMLWNQQTNRHRNSKPKSDPEIKLDPKPGPEIKLEPKSDTESEIKLDPKPGPEIKLEPKSDTESDTKSECPSIITYQCQICAYRSSRKGNFIRHVNGLHPDCFEDPLTWNHITNDDVPLSEMINDIGKQTVKVELIVSQDDIKCEPPFRSNANNLHTECTVATILGNQGQLTDEQEPPSIASSDKILDKSGIIYKCKLCEHSTKYAHGLKRHVGRLHPDCSEDPMSWDQLTDEKEATLETTNDNNMQELQCIYKCKICQHETKYASNFKRHVRNMHPDCTEDPMIILNVKEESQSQTSIDAAESVPQMIYKCKICQYETKHDHCLKRHVRTRHPDCTEDPMLWNTLFPEKQIIYKCKICHHETKYPKNFRYHVKSLHLDCTEDPMLWNHLTVGEKERLLKAHKNSVKVGSQTVFKCKLCKYRNKHASNFIKHMKFHHRGVKNRTLRSPLILTAQNDPKVEPDSIASNLEDRVIVEIKEEPNIEKEVTELPSKKSFTKSEKSKKQRNDKKKLVKRLKSKNKVINLHRAQFIKKSGKYSCHFCPFKSVYKDSAVRHENTVHFGYATIRKCHLCEYTTKSGMSRLHSHLKVRHGEGPTKFQHCTFCSYKTTITHSLNRHIQRIHPGGKLQPFKCHLCEYSGKNNVSLQRHLKFHHQLDVPLKQFFCEECPYSSTEQWQTNRHRQNVHKSPPIFTCANCDLQFPSMYLLKSHKWHYTSQNTTCDAEMKLESILDSFLYEGMPDLQPECILMEEPQEEFTDLNFNQDMNNDNTFDFDGDFDIDSLEGDNSDSFTQDLDVTMTELGVQGGIENKFERIVTTLKIKEESANRNLSGSAGDQNVTTEASNHDNIQKVAKIIVKVENVIGNRHKKDSLIVNTVCNTGRDGISIKGNGVIGRKFYGCRRCGKKYADLEILKKHVDLIHKKDWTDISTNKSGVKEKKEFQVTEPNQCHLCFVTCWTEIALLNHLSRHI